MCEDRRVEEKVHSILEENKRTITVLPLIKQLFSNRKVKI
jgi:hypothetical protein